MFPDAASGEPIPPFVNVARVPALWVTSGGRQLVCMITERRVAVLGCMASVCPVGVTEILYLFHCCFFGAVGAVAGQPTPT